MDFQWFNSLCTNQNVLTAADFGGSMHPDYKLCLYAQAIHETGNFSSAVWKRYHNMFGMKLSMQRKPLWLPPPDGFQWMGNTYYAMTIDSWRQIVKQLIDKHGEKARPYAYYGSDFTRGSDHHSETYLSLADRINWDVSNGIVFQSVEQYIAQVVQKSYAEDSGYSTKWMRLAQQLNKDLFVGADQNNSDTRAAKNSGTMAIILPLALWLMFKG